MAEKKSKITEAKKLEDKYYGSKITRNYENWNEILIF